MQKKYKIQNSPFVVHTEDGKIIKEAGQSIKVEKNTRLQYSNPFTEPCEYLAICLPAFSIESVNREDE